MLKRIGAKQACEMAYNYFEAGANDINRDIEKREGRINYSKGYYPCIHFHPVSFTSTVGSIIESEELTPRKLQFLDVGCGSGQKLFLANRVFGFQTSGIELRPALRDFAETTLNKLKVPHCISLGNALKFPQYSRFDVIYFYRPIRDEKLQGQLETKIAKEARVGAVVIPEYPVLYIEGNDGDFFNTNIEQRTKRLEALGWEKRRNTRDEAYYVRTSKKNSK